MAAMQVKDVIEKIRKLDSMSQLPPEDFADEDGLADSVAQGYKKDDLKPTQLRKVFHSLKVIQRAVEREDLSKGFDRGRVVTLLPELAYANGRGLIPRSFYELIKECLSENRLRTNADFLRAMDFVTAIIAYHRFRNPK